MGGGIGAMMVGTAMMGIMATSLVLDARESVAQDARNVVLVTKAEMPFTLGDSRRGCDHKGTDVFACSASETALRKPVQHLWTKAAKADRLSCLRGISPNYGPVTQLHSCLAARSG